MGCPRKSWMCFNDWKAAVVDGWQASAAPVPTNKAKVRCGESQRWVMSTEEAEPSNMAALNQHTQHVEQMEQVLSTMLCLRDTGRWLSFSLKSAWHSRSTVCKRKAQMRGGLAAHIVQYRQHQVSHLMDISVFLTRAKCPLLDCIYQQMHHPILVQSFYSSFFSEFNLMSTITLRVEPFDQINTNKEFTLNFYNKINPLSIQWMDYWVNNIYPHYCYKYIQAAGGIEFLRVGGVLHQHQTFFFFLRVVICRDFFPLKVLLAKLLNQHFLMYGLKM